MVHCAVPCCAVLCRAVPCCAVLRTGVWGATITWTGQRTITCFKNNFTELVPCDTANPAYYILTVFTDPKGWKESEIDWT